MESMFFTEQNNGIYTSYISLKEEQKIPMYETNLMNLNYIIIELLKLQEDRIIAGEKIIENLGIMILGDCLSELFYIIINIFNNSNLDGIYFKVLANVITEDSYNDKSYYYDTYIQNNIYADPIYYECIDKTVCMILGLALDAKEDSENEDIPNDLMIETLVEAVFPSETIKIYNDYYCGKETIERVLENSIMKREKKDL